MPKHSRPRKGSLQFWPRTRAKKILPSVNWKSISQEKPGILGFIVYKVGMKSAIVKDNTEHSLTKSKKIAVPATILEAPPIKIFSVRFYKHNQPVSEIIVSDDKELKKKLKLPKQKKSLEKELDKIKTEDYDDIRIIVYSLVNRTSIKKKPDITELALGGTKDQKLSTIKNLIGKEISLTDTIPSFEDNVVDVRGVTKGKGTQGPVKRFGIKLRFRKSEKGIRKVGSIGPWHPARVTFRVPMAGQMGFFSRISYNNNIIQSGKISEKDINPKGGWKNYGKINTEYIILGGSVAGPKKRQLLITTALRPTKKQSKKNFEFVELR